MYGGAEKRYVANLEMRELSWTVKRKERNACLCLLGELNSRVNNANNKSVLGVDLS